MAKCINDRLCLLYIIELNGREDMKIGLSFRIQYIKNGLQKKSLIVHPDRICKKFCGMDFNMVKVESTLLLLGAGSIIKLVQICNIGTSKAQRKRTTV